MATPHPTPSGDDELRKQVTDLLCDLLRHHDDDCQPGPLEVDSLLQLIEQECTAARVDELTRLNTHRHYGKDYQDSLDELHEYKYERIAQLEGKQPPERGQNG